MTPIRSGGAILALAFVVAFTLIGAAEPSAATSHSDYVDIDLTTDEAGYWLTTADGSVTVRGSATHFGDRPVLGSGEVVVALAPTPGDDGYWLFTNRGNAFEFGSAIHRGDVGDLMLAGDIVAAVATLDGGGYYLIGADGGIFALGNAVYHGSIPEVLPGVALDAPVVAISATADGYVLVAGDGGTFVFGTAAFHGSIPQILPGVTLASPVVGLVPGSAGYLMLGGDGGIFNFGVSQFHGSLSGVTEDGVVAVAVLSDLSGYLIVDDSGTVWPMGATRHIGVDSATGSGDAVVPFASDEPVIVYVRQNTGSLGLVVRDGSGATIDSLTDSSAPIEASFYVHAPTAIDLAVTSDGSWTVEIRPLSYARQWRATESTSETGGHAEVLRLVGPDAGARLLANLTGVGSVVAHNDDASAARLMASISQPPGQASTVIPTWAGPSVIDVRSAGAWQLDIGAASLPRRVDVTGDSVAITMEINFPNSMTDTFTVRDSAIEGCGIIDEGSMISGGLIRRGFSVCSNFAGRWAADVAAHNAEITVVVLGAWEVFDLWHLGATIPFGSAEHDAILNSGISEGVDALLATGTQVALLEVPCQYPRPGGGLTPLPERGEFWRTEHLNDLLRAEAATHSSVHFLTTPPEFCDDIAVGDNPSLRWDGTHYAPAGGAFVWAHLRDQILGLP